MTPVCAECSEVEVLAEGDTCTACAECATDGCDDMRTGPSYGQRYCERCTEELVAVTLEATPEYLRRHWADGEGFTDDAAIIREFW